MASVFGSRLDLLVRLIDTTTGAAVEESNVLFLRDGREVRPERKGRGTYIFINSGREDFLMRVRVKGFDEYETSVSYEGLDPSIPECNVFLIPSENTSKGEKLLGLSGNLPFLESLEAVNLSRIICFANEYDPKELKLGIFGQMGGRVYLYDTFYGIPDADRGSYERIEVLDEITPQSVRLRDPLEKELAPNSPLMRVVFGSVKENGDYCIRVRDDGKDVKYLLRYTVGGEERFKTVDFRDVKDVDLSVVPEIDPEVEAEESSEIPDNDGKVGE